MAANILSRLANLNRFSKIAFVLLAFVVAALFLSKNYILEAGKSEDVVIDTWEYSMTNVLKNSEPVDVLQEFYKMADLLHFKAVVIEPRILFDHIDIADKDVLVQKGFTVIEPSGKHNISIISIALIGYNAKNLNKLMSSGKGLSTCMKHWSASTAITAGDWIPVGLTHSKNISGHHFFQCQSTLIHGIVFYGRANYYWHAALPRDTTLPVPREDLIFVNASAYERFTLTPVTRTEGKKMQKFYRPSKTAQFLMEIESSQFIECDPWRASSLQKKDMEKTPRYHTLKDVFSNSINLLKKHLHPQLKMFFIFAGTLLGWYRQCDIIPYTSDVDFASWSTDIGSEEYWTKTFAPGKGDLKLGELMGLPEKGFELSFRLHGNKVDMFFIYRNETMSWAFGHRPSKGYYFTYNYPKFSLCSGDLVGHKVLVPCKPEEVLKAEYGPLWRKPATSWYYETNPRNMGERQFWTPDERKRASKFFT